MKAAYINLGIVIFSLVFFSTTCVSSAAQEKANGMEALDSKEEAVLRKIFYTTGIPTTFRSLDKDSRPTRVVVVPKEFEQLHKAKRVAVLKLVLNIVKGARSEDALKATALAVAMEQHPIIALSYVDGSWKGFDDELPGCKKTPRSLLVIMLGEMVAKAEKEVQQRRNEKKEPL